MVEWFEKLDMLLVCDLLERWPTLEELQNVSAEELRRFFRQHHCHRGLMERRILAIGRAIPAKGDRAVSEQSIWLTQRKTASRARDLNGGLAHTVNLGAKKLQRF